MLTPQLSPAGDPPYRLRSEHLFATPWLRLPGSLYQGESNSVYFDCGKTPLGLPAADAYEITFAALAWVDADQPSGSIVRVLVTGNARDRANPSAMLACSGTGKLEAALLQAIQRRLRLAAKSAS